MTDTNLLENQITGLKAKIKDLRSDERIFLKASGLEEEAEKAKIEVAEFENKIQAEKEDISDLRSKKTAALQKTIKAFAKTMSTILPSGQALFNIQGDGVVFIGWKNGDRTTPYEGLSGGERVTFDSALSYALLGDAENKVIILEAAELDGPNFTATLAHLEKSNPDAQLIVNSCHVPSKIPEGWAVVKFK